MKLTIDVPDELYRRLKAKSALEGRPLREVAIEVFASYEEGVPAAMGAGGRATSRSPRPTAPSWVGVAGKYGAKVRGVSPAAVRRAIARGWREEIAETEGAVREGRD